MSYSRFSNSEWYTFWCVPDEGVTENRDNAKFEICPFTTFTASELRNDIEGCLNVVREMELYSGGNPSELDMDELRVYMLRFLKDVDAAYPETEDA